ncbi:MAG: DUF1622 domain-containing protein [Geminicoccaceae bacterium]|nr:DUF1622 domain-containing protein [Geminicoccaceae bacterium]
MLEAAAGKPEWFDLILHTVSWVMELAGVGVIALGAVAAMAVLLRHLLSHTPRAELYHRFRTTLARAILLGLEFLVAADIIGTVAVEPSAENLAVLALIVLIRTFLSFSLQIEIDGRLPWQRRVEN